MQASIPCTAFAVCRVVEVLPQVSQRAQHALIKDYRLNYMGVPDETLAIPQLIHIEVAGFAVLRCFSTINRMTHISVTLGGCH